MSDLKPLKFEYQHIYDQLHAGVRLIILVLVSLTVDSQANRSGVFACLVRDNTLIHGRVLHCGRYHHQGA